MNVKRLKRMVDILCQVQEEKRKFSIYSWIYTGEDEGKDLGVIKEISCGTSACAIGYACMDKVFFSEGLQMLNEPDGYVPTYDGFRGFRAVAEFFEIDTYTAIYLFSFEEYAPDPTAYDVAERIQEVINWE